MCHQQICVVCSFFPFGSHLLYFSLLLLVNILQRKRIKKVKRPNQVYKHKPQDQDPSCKINGKDLWWWLVKKYSEKMYTIFFLCEMFTVTSYSIAALEQVNLFTLLQNLQHVYFEEHWYLYLSFYYYQKICNAKFSLKLNYVHMYIISLLSFSCGLDWIHGFVLCYTTNLTKPQIQ